MSDGYRPVCQFMKETHSSENLPRHGLACPLCARGSLTEGWFSLSYADRIFDFPQCRFCFSYFCHPMPEEATLIQMYDAGYVESGEDCGDDFAKTKFDEVRRFLRSVKPQTLIDYGCGSGQLLIEAKELGWKVLGIDFNPDFAENLREEGIKVIRPDVPAGDQVDVLHLGDVIEHLTDMENQFPKILDLLKDGGYLVAHGPLEANPNMFFRFVRAIKKLRGNRVTQMPPYHVILATTKGQRTLFERFGLKEVEYRSSEVAWPAPSTFTAAGTDPRKIVLLLLRKISRLTSRARMDELGNRYFYVGQKPELSPDQKS